MGVENENPGGLVLMILALTRSYAPNFEHWPSPTGQNNEPGPPLLRLTFGSLCLLQYMASRNALHGETTPEAVVWGRGTTQ